LQTLLAALLLISRNSPNWTLESVKGTADRAAGRSQQVLLARAPALE
jgi:hypothetical protein